MEKLNELLKNLEAPINYLVRYVNRLPGLTKEDLAQELRLMVAQNYDYNIDKSEGWWFIKLKWYLINMINRVRVSKKPLDNIDDSINLEENEE